ncbi:MAG: hypothetical protein KME35_07095 [Aphanocapsa sp. GSE-SYN-MK-11-07L]|jgi:hypothetical protein|nr:hypothetical protein [Aphanocapsa sp. GSE-SYN-MK-11-07L]
MKSLVRVRPQRLWFERVMAIVATANLGLVLFDLSYVPWRDFWLQGKIQIPLIKVGVRLQMPPQITEWYDPIKGIEPYRETQQYLETVQQLQQQVNQFGLESPQAQATLNRLGKLSSEMIETNPFQLANKSGALEKIKSRMRSRIFGTTVNTSARQSFNIFWSSKYLTPATWSKEITWFNAQIVPLIQTNYFRSLDETGNFTDDFGQLDIWFNVLFALEFAARTFVISRRHPGLSWRDAMLWRWYDVLLFFPFWLFLPSWGWLRIIPVEIRLHQAKLVNLERIRRQVTQGFVTSIAQELSQAVVLQVLSQVQATLRRGDFSWLLQPAQSQALTKYQPDSVNEVAAIASLLVKVTVYDVLPRIQPDVEAILRHNIEQILSQAPAYSTLKSLPGLGGLPSQLTERLATEIVQSTYNILTSSMADSVGAELTQNLVQHVQQALISELRQQQVLTEVQILVSEWLEKVKHSYGK